MKNFHNFFVWWGLLICFSSGCSKGDARYQFALDAVASRPDFAQDEKHWACLFSYSSDTTKMNQEDIAHGVFLAGALPKNNNGLLPKEGEVVVCWQDKNKMVHLSIFDLQSKTERLVVPLSVTECSEGPL